MHLERGALYNVSCPGQEGCSTISHKLIRFNNIFSVLLYLYEKPPHNNGNVGGAFISFIIKYGALPVELLSPLKPPPSQYTKYAWEKAKRGAPIVGTHLSV